jgi:hypothetical protein
VAPVPIEDLDSRLVYRHPHVVQLQPVVEQRRDLGVVGAFGVVVSPRQPLRNWASEHFTEVPRLGNRWVLDQGEKIGAGRSQRAVNVVLS